MFKGVKYLFLSIAILSAHISACQDMTASDVAGKEADVFESEDILSIRLSYSIKEVRKKTKDHSYIDSELAYQLSDGSWKNMKVKLRARGQTRRETCYFTPIKVKINKTERKGSVFEKHKKLKLVLPCLVEEAMNDKLLREYLAYQIYAQVGDYHFKTRLLEIDFKEVRGKKTRDFELKGFFIENVDELADRYGANVINNRKVHPLEQDDHASVQNAVFQFMIGNTDFSTAYMHNIELIFIEGKKAIPVPYDFDLCGLVDAKYAVVSEIKDQALPISSVTERIYRGYRRSNLIFNKVRREYLSARNDVLAEVNKLKPLFHDVQEFNKANEYVLDFYRILGNDSEFSNEIVNKARIK